MKHRLATIIMIGLSVMSLWSCKTTEQTEPTEIIPLEKALLWQIEGKELTAPSYVFGTMHMIDAADYFLPKGTEKAIDEVDKIAFEIDMSEMNDMGKMMSILPKTYMRNNTTLKDIMSAEDYQLVVEHFQSLGLPMMFFDRMKPMFLTVFGGEGMSLEDLNSGKIRSYEMELMKMAEAKSMPIHGLETLEYQLSIFDSIPYSDQAAMLLESIKMAHEGTDALKELMAIYVNQDIEQLYAMVMQDSTMANYDEALLLKRNKNWIPVMSEMMQEGATFFAVGAGHLAGEQGVLRLLQRAGYKIKPVSVQATQI